MEDANDLADACSSFDLPATFEAKEDIPLTRPSRGQIGWDTVWIR